jgi:CBS domain containing-hemolysin-like protein
VSSTAALTWVLLALAASAFFSGSESAVISVNRIRLNHLAAQGERRARILTRTLERPELLLAVILIGNNLAHVVLAGVTSAFLRGFDLGPLYTTIAITPVLIIFGEILPKTLFVKFADRVALLIAYPLRGIELLLYPVALSLSALSRKLTRLLGAPDAPRALQISKEELKLLITMTRSESDIPEDERRMLERLFEFTEHTVEMVMTPLVDMVGLPADAELSRAVDKIMETGLSSIVLYEGSIHNPLGVIRAEDILGAEQLPETVAGLVRPVPYVPENRPVEDLMADFQRRNEDLAFVVNEYGATIGLVTLEDLLEEVIGEIEDEYDPHQEVRIRKIAPDTWLASGRIEIDHLRELLDIPIPTGDFETLAGLVLLVAKRIPRPGERFRVGELELTVVDADERRVLQVQIRKRPPSPEGERS